MAEAESEWGRQDHSMPVDLDSITLVPGSIFEIIRVTLLTK
jgi:hypothetical protein